MNKEKQVTIKMDVRTAAAIRQVLFEHQRGHSYEFPSERITDIRSVIYDLDDNIRLIVGEE
jgi:biotin synthase-related radical SAM superfamily protein